MERIWYVVAFAVFIYFTASYIVTAKNPVASPVATSTSQTTTKTVDTTNVDACIQQANDLYTQSWSNDCQSEYMRCVENGVSDSQCTSWYGGMCSLGNTVASDLANNLQRDKLDCYREN